MRHRSKKGDTLVEVMIAVGIFGSVAIGAISVMNRGLYDAQQSLEITMARNEIDAQAEALRFLHSAYISESRSSLTVRNTIYSHIWTDLIDHLAYKPNSADLTNFFDAYNNEPCDKIYSSNAFPKNAFVVNLRRIDNSIVASYTTPSEDYDAGEGHLSPVQFRGEGIIVRSKFQYNLDGSPNGIGTNVLEQTPTFPRLLFTGITPSGEETEDSYSDNDVNKTATTQTILAKAQGVWVTAIAANNTETPDYYDFHIRTCWSSPGKDTPNTISTTIRLFNPR